MSHSVDLCLMALVESRLYRRGLSRSEDPMSSLGLRKTRLVRSGCAAVGSSESLLPLDA